MIRCAIPKNHPEFLAIALAADPTIAEDPDRFIDTVMTSLEMTLSEIAVLATAYNATQATTQDDLPSCFGRKHDDSFAATVEVRCALLLQLC
jgi:hypothetical protein